MQGKYSDSGSEVKVKRKLQVAMEVKGERESDIAKWQSNIKVEMKCQMEMDNESDD